MISPADLVRNCVRQDFAIADVSHDFNHLQRVADMSAYIAGKLGVEADLVRIASYVHDYHRIEEARRSGESRSVVSPVAARPAIENVLARCNVPRQWWSDILAAVELTGHYSFSRESERYNQLSKAASDEVKAVVDADNLDAIGAIGIGRAFAFGGVLGEPLWRPDELLLKEYKEGQTSSVLAHVYEKLAHLECDMLTAPARLIAGERTLLLHRFVADFRAEWEHPIQSAPFSHWDPESRYLMISQVVAESNAEAVRVSFRSKVELEFSQDQRLVRFTVYPVPDMLAATVGSSVSNSGDIGSGRTVLNVAREGDSCILVGNLTSDRPQQRISGMADAEMRISGSAIEDLKLHLVSQPNGSDN